MRGLRATLALAVLAACLTAPAAASAGTLGVLPAKSCYREGEKALLGGGGYTPNGTVQVNLNGRALSLLNTDPGGNFGGVLTIGALSGERINTYTAIDTSNTANQGTKQIRVTSLGVSVHPKSGAPGRVVRIKARGFTTGKTLYMHIRRRHLHLNRRIGKLKGACRKLSVKRKVFSAHTHTGTYRVYFDGKRKFSTKTKVQVGFHVTVFAHFASHASAAQSWTRIR
jgi:hypothetical protein